MSQLPYIKLCEPKIPYCLCHESFILLSGSLRVIKQWSNAYLLTSSLHQALYTLYFNLPEVYMNDYVLKEKSVSDDTMHFYVTLFDSVVDFVSVLYLSTTLHLGLK